MDIPGTDYIGLAAIRVALAYGLQVFVVVSSEDDKYLLLSYFPELNGKSFEVKFQWKRYLFYSIFLFLTILHRFEYKHII